MSLLPKNKIIAWNLLVSTALNLALWILLYLKIQPQVDPIVLRYSVYFGISQIGEWWRVFYFPLVGIIFLLFDFILIFIIQKRDRHLAKFFAFLTSFLQFLLLIIGFFTVMLNV